MGLISGSAHHSGYSAFLEPQTSTQVIATTSFLGLKTQRCRSVCPDLDSSLKKEPLNRLVYFARFRTKN